MVTESVQSACDDPHSRVADYFRLAAGDPVLAQEEAEEAILGRSFVASGHLDQSYRAIRAWVRRAWQGQGSVVRQEGRVKVSSALLGGLWRPPAVLDYTVLYSLGPPPAQLPAGAWEDLTRVLVSGEFFSGGWSTQRAVGSLGAAAADVLQRLAGHGIVLPNTQEVAAYLAAHPQLARLLPNIGAEVRQALGPQVELSLELYKDPEIDDRYLTLYLRKEKYEPHILDRLQAVSERFNHRLEEVPGYFLLATDFSRPRGSHGV